MAFDLSQDFMRIKALFPVERDLIYDKLVICNIVMFEVIVLEWITLKV